jgi:hypothetical protein
MCGGEKRDDTTCWLMLIIIIIKRSGNNTRTSALAALTFLSRASFVTWCGRDINNPNSHDANHPPRHRTVRHDKELL